MSELSDSLSFSLSDSSEMIEEQADLEELVKTQFTGPGAQLSDEQIKRKASKHRLAKMFGRNLKNYEWSELNDENKFEKIQVFKNGGFADVTLLKSRKGSGKLIIVKSNRLEGKNQDCVKVDTVNEVKQMTAVKSIYVIRCLGYSEIDAGKEHYAIIMEYLAYLSKFLI